MSHIEENEHNNYQPSKLFSDDCEDMYDSDEDTMFNEDIMIKNNNHPETGEFRKIETYVYKLTDANIKSGDYLYAVRTSEPDEIWVVYSPITKYGPGHDIWWGVEHGEYENRFHHSCLVESEKTVYIAGELMIRIISDNEKYIYINCASGHYQPKQENLKILISLLKKKFPDYKIMNWKEGDCVTPLIDRKLEEATQIGGKLHKKRTNKKRTNKKRTNKKRTNKKKFIIT